MFELGVGVGVGKGGQMSTTAMTNSDNDNGNLTRTGIFYFSHTDCLNGKHVATSTIVGVEWLFAPPQADFWVLIRVCCAVEMGN